ncbi:OmpA family protein [Pseudooceanicola aestuarii]|uniref:OmpA family protein n=1 Tax=Pseudooceanicola aestuarii TaxID=2697319 RepID=UPI0013D81255|nr:OmpA family protein [Pseudooceanicola aestuarii]
MKQRFLKSTTAIALAVAVAMPAPILAQDDDLANRIEELRIQLQQMESSETGVDSDRITSADSMGEALRSQIDELEAELARQQEAEAQAAAEAEATEQPAEDAPAEETAEQPAEDAPAEETTEQPAEDAPAEETTEQPAEDVPAEETTEQPAEDAPAEETAEQPAEDVPAEETAEQPAEDAPAEETAEQPAEDAPAEETAEQPAEDAPAEETAEQPAEEDSAQDEVVQQDSEAQAQAEAEAAQQATESMAAQGGDAAEVREEQVTEETARSAEEDFDTSVSGEANAEAQADTNDEDRGLSTAGKAALLGLGALAVGQVLKSGEKVVTNSGDRVVVEENGRYRVLKDDDALLRRPGSDVKTYAFDDGSTRTVVTRENGAQVETIRSADGRVLRRTRILPDGREVVLFDDTRQVADVDVNELPQVRESDGVDMARADETSLRRALEAELARDVNRTFSLSQVRNIDSVRALVPEIEVDTINFDTGSAAIRPEEAEELAELGTLMRDLIDRNPQEVFLIEGHTDAVGNAGYNLALSDRRAETVALALTQYFDVPPENMVVQGYGESDLKIRTSDANRENRRAAVRRITQLLTES